MKTLLAIILLGLSTLASAEICTNVIRDSRGYEWETFTRSSYSQQSACDLAAYPVNPVILDTILVKSS